MAGSVETGTKKPSGRLLITFRKPNGIFPK
jgi:hypothetical protein